MFGLMFGFWMLLFVYWIGYDLLVLGCFGLEYCVVGVVVLDLGLIVLLYFDFLLLCENFTCMLIVCWLRFAWIDGWF